MTKSEYSITAHCLVRNEEVFVGSAILSVIDFVDKILAYDTGSTDNTVRIINEISIKYPGKIIFEEKGPCDKKQHTALRQEMLERTDTRWFMILDGDEVWTKRGMQEILEAMRSNPNVECVFSKFYLCVGDIYHQYYKKGSIELIGEKGFFYPRFFKITKGIHWTGDYNEDTLLTEKNAVFFAKDNSIIIKNKFWHVTHLTRSSKDDEDYSSGGTRKEKRRETYFFIGRKIDESVPEVFIGTKLNKKMNYCRSFINFFLWIIRKLTKNFGK